MAKPWYKSFIPDSSTLQQHPSLQRFGPALQHPSLWQLSRRSARAAVAVGLFCAMLPIPVQMLLAAFLAIWLRGHLPLTIALVWLNNPITIAPIFYAGYKLGSWMLGTSPKDIQFELSTEWLWTQLADIGLPLLLGSVSLGLLLGLTGALLLDFCWRLGLKRRWAARARRH
ncbi:DUF2062 domain-containing protein [Rheinheimera sp. 4Y26]|uniref:DUF2062 domain-containing protein n=1 Tax=Rheinheimera sp. 4Y26 TaxID=2977811 RepID=UPI0021B0AA0B|nr:DUF2062 domain-containing protein [Rheinheimera sp. 4Y26]MCT6699706.1 DUF2062 domain-containing protein [Rheinheimera sp. 4Y26]